MHTHTYTYIHIQTYIHVCKYTMHVCINICMSKYVNMMTLYKCTCMGPSIYDVHTEGVRLRWTGEGWSSPMWTSTQKIKIRVHSRHTVFFSCKEVGVFFYQNFVFGQKK